MPPRLTSRIPLPLRRHAVAVLLALAVVACKEPSTEPHLPRDSLAPELSGMVVGWSGRPAVSRGAGVFGPGDTLRFQVEAVDADGALLWIGLEFTGDIAFADSLIVPDSFRVDGALLSYWIVPDAQFFGTTTVRGFARDSAGNRADIALSPYPVSVYRRVARGGSPRAISGLVGDIVVDDTRGLVYLAQPGRSRIAVLSLVTMAFLPDLVPPGPPAGMDLSVSGETLLVAVPSLRSVAIADLSGATPQWSTLPLVFDTSSSLSPRNLRVTARNRALIAMGPPPGLFAFAGRLIEYDLAAGTQRFRTDVSANGSTPGALTDRTPMARSADRLRLLLVHDNACCPLRAQVFDAPGDTFLPLQPTVELFEPPLAASGTGSAFSISRIVFSGSLTDAKPFGIPGVFWDPIALSQGGDTIYIGYGAGFFRSRSGDGVTLEYTMPPESLVRLVSLPGAGERLLGLSATKVWLLDLTGTAYQSPASAARSRSGVPTSHQRRAVTSYGRITSPASARSR